VRDLLRNCLRSLAQHAATAHQQHIIVVDNASDDGTAEMLREEFPAVHLQANTTNRGFTGGNNDGLRIADALMVHGEAERFLLLLNPDTEVRAGTLDALLAFAQANHDVGLVGPRLRYADGRIQSSRRRFPDLVTALFESTWLQWVGPRRKLDQYYMREHADDETCDVDWVVGAAMLVRYAAYKAVGGLDEVRFFMYSEETDWCWRMKHAGWRVVYFPPAEVLHYEARSSGQVSARRMILFNTSKVRFIEKHYGAWQAGVLRVWLLGQFAWQLVLEGAKWLLGNQRVVRAARIRAYGGVLASGLK
jgi:hypothetical protein